MSKRTKPDNLITARQLVSLEQIAEDAVQKATAAVGKLLATEIEINALKARSVPARAVPDLVGDPEAICAAIYMKVGGDAPGHAAFICPEDQALRLVEMLTGSAPDSLYFLDTLGASALQEMGNILTSSYLNSLSQHTGLCFFPEPPQLAVDMGYAIVSALLVGTVEASTESLSIVTEFGRDFGPLQGHFVYIPETPSLPVIAKNLREAA